eukprot:CAMPEP_0172718888 /NCGR_PEP_ID=MMETSP1074-20121228/75186_1 /TAXON_ID=2916 /ORGANISM="Ceratium fusus, Strain PA161109" /LENGTH=225 /DNA_ID=CAMNT_0013544175 /DNA_START=68 /DNA_END=745 /DNA_ORIENTATION=+
MSMQLVLLSTMVFTANAGFFSGGPGFLSPRTRSTNDLDLRKAVQEDVQEDVLIAETSTADMPPMSAAMEGSRQETLNATNSLGNPGGATHAAATISMEVAPIATANSSDELVVPAVEQETLASERPQRKQRPTKRTVEASVIDSLRHMGEEGEEAMVCVTNCRFGEAARHEWRECLERCVHNPLMRSTLLSLLPKKHHTAHSAEVEVPEILQKKMERKRQRSAEL